MGTVATFDIMGRPERDFILRGTVHMLVASFLQRGQKNFTDWSIAVLDELTINSTAASDGLEFLDTTVVSSIRPDTSIDIISSIHQNVLVVEMIVQIWVGLRGYIRLKVNGPFRSWAVSIEGRS